MIFDRPGSEMLSMECFLSDSLGFVTPLIQQASLLKDLSAFFSISETSIVVGIPWYLEARRSGCGHGKIVALSMLSVSSETRLIQGRSP